MADQIKEISNGTYGIGALSNGVPIASTNATTEYVVKDIHVQNNTLPSVGANLNFNVNNVTAASLNSSVTGSELIDVSSTAVAVASPAAFTVMNFENWMATGSTGSRINSLSTRSVNNVAASTTNTQSAAISAIPGPNNTIVSWATIGSNFYYWSHDGNSGQALYRRAGGVNGTETTIANVGSYMPVVFNGVDKFHWVDSSVIYTHNATTNTNTSVSLITTATQWNGTLSSYPRIDFANGLVFLQNSTYGPVFAINPTTGRMSEIGGMGAPTVNTAFAVHLNAGVYTLLYTSGTSGGNTGTIYFNSVSESSVGPLTTVNTTPSSTYLGSIANEYSPEHNLQNYWPKKDADGNFIFLDVSSAAPIFVYKRANMVTRTLVSPITVNMSSVSPNTTDATRAPFRTLSTVDDSANKLNTTFYPQTATLRVTGVETTL